MSKKIMIILLVIMVSLGLTVSVYAEERVLNVCDLLGWELTVPVWEKLPEFEKETGIKVNVIGIPFKDLIQKQMLSLTQPQRKGDFDIIVGSESMVSALYKFMVPFEDLCKENEGVLKEFGLTYEDIVKDIYPVMLGYMTFEEKLYFYPNCVSTQIGWYRKDLLEDPEEKVAFKKMYGYELPIQPEDPQQLLDVAKFFTRDIDGDGKTDLWGLLIPGKWDHGTCIFEDQIFRAGLQFFDQNYHCMWGPVHPENQEEVVEIATYLQNLIYKWKVVPPEVVSWEMAEMIKSYEANKSALAIMWLEGLWTEVQSEKIVEKIGETGAFVVPGRKPMFGGFAGGWGYGIPQGTPQNKIEDALRFLSWYHQLMPQIDAPYPATISGAKARTERGTLPWAHLDGGIRDAQIWNPSPIELERCRILERENYEKLLMKILTPQEFVKITGEGIENIMEEAGYFE